MSIILTLIVYLIVLGLLYWLVTMLPLPAPIDKIVQVLFVIICILAVLSLFGVLPGPGHLPLLR